MPHGLRIYATRDLTGATLSKPHRRVTVSWNTEGVTLGHYEGRMIVRFDGLPEALLVNDEDLHPVERLGHIRE